ERRTSGPGGRSPTRGRIYARGSLSLIINFQLAGREESIYGYMTASVPKRVGPFESPLTAWAGPYMSLNFRDEVVSVEYYKIRASQETKASDRLAVTVRRITG